MRNKQEIANDWLPRYTGTPLDSFGQFVLLCNFSSYLHAFSKQYDVPIQGLDKPMQTVTYQDVTLINFGMGSSAAATIVDLLSSISPKAVLFLGKCGALKKKNKIGDFIVPIAGIRGEGTSNQYLPPEVPALPSFALQKALSTTIMHHNLDYWTGTVFTTNRRLWEHDDIFKRHLQTMRAMAIDMETATIFSVGFANQIPRGALLYVSDNPMVPEGIKSAKRDSGISKEYTNLHLNLGIETVQYLKKCKETMKHLKF